MPYSETKANANTVLCLGLTPAFQRTMIFDGFRPGAVNRAVETVISNGGKGVNTAVALALLRRPCVAAGFNGGETGRFISARLTALGVTCAFTRTPWPTRTCVTLFDRRNGEVTELVEEARRPTPVLLRRLEVRGKALLRRVRVGVICGKLPPGVPENTWARLAAEAQRLQVPLIIDSHAQPLLQCLRHEPLVAKMNVHELEKTFNTTCQTAAAIVATAKPLTAGGAAWALITQGAQPAILLSSTGATWRIFPPKVRNTLSFIGCGDCVTAGLVDALLRGEPMVDAVRFGLGCGSANALTYTPADFHPVTARTLAATCRVVQMR